MKEGWGLPWNAQKWHYFVGMFSLCGKWMYAGELEQGKDDPPSNCKKCLKLLKRRQQNVAHR